MDRLFFGFGRYWDQWIGAAIKRQSPVQ